MGAGGEERARLYPDTFELPDFAVRAGLRPGDFAELIFRISLDGDVGAVATERMWVLVSEHGEDGYFGLLQSVPESITENPYFWLGDEIPFRPHHVIDVLDGDEASQAAACALPRNVWFR